MAGKFEIYQDKKGEHRFRLKAGNGQTILSSEGYSSKSACDNGIASVRKNAPDDGRYERKQGASGKHHFNLKAGNHQVIGSSQMYESSDGCESGIDSVKRNAPGAEVDDQTA